MTTLSYLRSYPAALLERIQTLLEQDQLGAWLERKYPARHDIQTDKALYQYVTELKQRYLKNAPAMAKVLYDSQQHPMKGTLGTNTFVARVQGGKLKSKNEIRIAALFRDAPEAFLRMIVIHELAHLKEKDHDKAFYQLCRHMEPDYHQLEFDMRVWLTWRERI
ncbi:metal-dependent hydrolase [Chromobacterium amazonense]|uniref:YgjP-like metallopeptidase domain-containing protein n=1 Tax=Chromobacterium amazonense TaxID=1382803 RepID=UPI0008DB0EEF|nr:YgjP-like metallopeptidase domain-containing protein [Chromobacterium amazonense]OHX10970.1 metal-dependent hydrolase [Chromobacterium amazonense]